MSNQSPAEAQEELEKLLDFIIDRVSYMINQSVAGDWREQTKKPIRSRVTAYAATVEREAANKREVYPTYYLYKCPNGIHEFELTEVCTHCLAALQGPIQGNSKDENEQDSHS